MRIYILNNLKLQRNGYNALFKNIVYLSDKTAVGQLYQLRLGDRDVDTQVLDSFCRKNHPVQHVNIYRHLFKRTGQRWVDISFAAGQRDSANHVLPVAIRVPGAKALASAIDSSHASIAKVSLFNVPFHQN